MKLQGIYIDTATPFDHAGDLYRIKIEHNIGRWNQTSVAGYVVGGFTGEGTLLAAEEKLELWKIAAATAGSGKMLIAGIDSPGVREAARMTNQAAGLGYAAALVETPRCERVEIRMLYFRSVADRANIPILISNRSDLGVEAILALLGHPNICGIVDHCGGPARIRSFGDAAVLWGLESSLWDALRGGACGAVLPFANAAPYATIALWEAFRTREEEAALDWQSRIEPPARLIRDRVGIPGLKHAMDINGYYGGPPRLPWIAPNGAEKAEIQAAFADLKG